MAASDSSTAIFFIVCFAALAGLLAFWMWAVNNRKRQARILGTTISAPRPQHQTRSRFGGDPVNRMEAGENTDGLPKYTPQARIGEHTVDRSVTAVELNEANNNRSGWLTTRPSIFGQLSQFPSRPPPAYDPSTHRGS